jgi:hypothetical protein
MSTCALVLKAISNFFLVLTNQWLKYGFSMFTLLCYHEVFKKMSTHVHTYFIDNFFVLSIRRIKHSHGVTRQNCNNYLSLTILVFSLFDFLCNPLFPMGK